MEWVKVASKSQAGRLYYFQPATNKAYWHDDTLPEGWAWGQHPPGTHIHTQAHTHEEAKSATSSGSSAHGSADAGKFYIHLATGTITDTRPTAAGTKRSRSEPEDGDSHTHVNNTISNHTSNTHVPAVGSGTMNSATEAHAQAYVHAAGAAAAAKAAALPLPDACVCVSLQLLAPSVDGRALNRLRLYLTADVSSARVGVSASPHVFHVALDGPAPPKQPALVSGTAHVRIAVGAAAGHAHGAQGWLHAAADRSRVLCHPGAHTQMQTHTAELASLPDAAPADAERWRVVRGAYNDTGAQFLALQSVATSCFCFLSRPSGGSERDWHIVQRDDLPDDADAAAVLQAALTGGDCVPLMVAPVFQQDLCPIILHKSAHGGDVASSALPPAAVLDVLAVLGVPVATAPAMQAGTGLRARVYRANLGEDGTQIVKVQPFDGRVEHEVKVMETLALARTGPSPPAGIRSLMVHYGILQDDARSFFVLRDSGTPLEDIVSKAEGGARPLHPSVVCTILRVVLEALQALHEIGYLYCDLHPDNVLVPRELPAMAAGARDSPPRRRGTSSYESETWSDPGFSPRVPDTTAPADKAAPSAVSTAAAAGSAYAWERLTLIDLGSAVQLQRARSVSSMAAAGRAGLEYRGPTRGGKWVYMPPEQFGPGAYASGDVVLYPASDVYTAAAVASFLLTAEPPFQPTHGGKVTVPATKTHTRRDPALLRVHVAKTIQRSFPDAGAHPATVTLLDVLSRALHQEPARRYLSAAEMRDALRDLACLATNTQQAPGAQADSAAGGAAGAEGQQAGQEFVDDTPIDEPFAAKLSRWIWNTIKYSFGATIVGVVFYAGYTIVVTLLPGGASANAIMRKATAVLSHDPEIVQSFGEIKTYGDDYGARTEGRRYFVPEYTYTDDLTDEKYHRIRFTLEGERGKKATVWAEVHAGTYDFKYLIVLAKDRSRVWSVVDHRRPEPTEEERQARVTTLLQDAGWTFYADSELDIRDQSAVLGDYWLKVKYVRCDDDPTRCEEAGVPYKPAWSTSGPFVKGVKSLHDLEVMVKPLAKAKDGKKGWSLF